MLQEFKEFITSRKLFNPSDTIMLTVSGGIDSVVMCELFHRAEYKFGIAHCNFSLRGKESDDDEKFVRKLSEKYHVPFFTKQFFTTKDAKEKGISIQMAARELRYQWFEEIRKKNKYKFIATAHHLDDQAETFFINLLRSTGIAGLHGILPSQGKIIHPMMFCFRNEIAAFARKNKLAHREDSSNSEHKYLRNKIRHEIIPIFRELNPSFPKQIADTVKRLRETEIIFTRSVERIRKKIIRKDENGLHILISELKKSEAVDILAYELLSPFGFNEDVIRDVLNSRDDSSGQTFFSTTHRLVKNRKEIIIAPLPGKKGPRSENIRILIPENKKVIRKPLHLVFTKKEGGKKFTIDPSIDAANLDMRKILFPLILRRWEKGDSFFPFGMEKKKKLSDYFIDNKFSIPEKENTWLLCSGNNILWIVGHRIDHRYRITPQTKEVLQVRWVAKK